MSHNAFARPQALWSGISVPNARDLSIWDTYQFKGLNGDAGGTYAPATPIILGGSGLALSGAGNSIQATTRTMQGGRLQLGSNDYVQLDARTRTEVMGLVGALPDQIQQGLGGEACWSNVLSASPLGISPISPLAGNDFTVPIPSRYLHQGAQLTSATLTMRALVRQAAQAAPPYWMFANIIAMNAAASSSLSVVPTMAAWQASHAYTVGAAVFPNNQSVSQTGYYYEVTGGFGTHTSASTPPTWPTTIGATVIDNAGANEIQWTCIVHAGILPNPNVGAGAQYQGGLVQSSVMSPPVATPFVIDCTTYDYFLQVSYDSFGSGSLAAPNWLFHALALTYGDIVDMRPE